MIISKKPPYATTSVDPERSQLEINKLLREYGVSGLQWSTRFDLNQVELSFMVEAEIQGVRKQIAIKVSPPIFVAKRRTWNARKGTYEIVHAPNWAQSFRMLYFWLKSKLEAVAYGLSTVEKEFLSQVIVTLPSGQSTTIGEALTETIGSGRLALETKVEREQPRIIETEVLPGVQEIDQA